MNTKTVILTLLAVTLISAAATITMQRLQVAYALAPPFCHNCAKDLAPGQEAKSPGDASNFAPGQEAQNSEGEFTAKDFAPGQVFKKGIN